MGINTEERTVGGLHDFLQQEIMNLPRGTAVLDLGCGSGAWLGRLAQLGFHDLSGIDTAPPVDVPSNVKIFRADLDRESPLLEDRRFGVISAIEVIEHLENPGRFWSLIATYLALDGLALVTTPNIHSLRCRLKFLLTGKMASFDEKGDPTHLIPLLLPGLQRVLLAHGLSIVRIWSYPARGSLIFGMPVRTLSWLLRFVVPDRYQGDTLCLAIRRATDNE